MIYGNKFYGYGIGDLTDFLGIISADVQTIESLYNNYNESFDIVNESAADVFNTIVDKAKEVFAKFIDIISKVFKKFIPKLYEAMQKLVTKLRGTEIKITSKKTVVYYNTTELFDKYAKAVFDYSDMIDKHYSIICNIFTYKDASKEVKEAIESKKKLDELNEQIIKISGITASSSTSEFEDKMITKSEEELTSESDSAAITNCINKFNSVISDIKDEIAIVNSLSDWLNKVKKDVDELVKSKSFEAFDKMMTNKEPMVIGDDSYGDTKLLQAIGLQEVTRTAIRHFSNLMHLENVYLNKNIQSYKSLCDLYKNTDNYNEDIIDSSLFNKSEEENED